MVSIVFAITYLACRYIGSGRVVDAKNSPSIGKYANHYVHGVFSINCKVKNEKGKAKMVATREIRPGEELFWNYGKSFWQGKDYKITKKKLEELKDDVLYRDCDK
ncbi:MAG TPA: SET domain-containing protein-lysine N-methyltransferase [Candidatus Dojkabacteria bacterium]|nr:SET domain-containing protein-lysine N-methyltransferase [Ferruginibacter sp.]HRP37193.1 SET domain-containing protein-lysine N-methyltransferase [Candidatus Dojkabacteria bacterium]